jgi:preprotein translocase subunit YajC
MEGLPNLFLQAAPDLISQMMPFLLIVVVMYFFFIRPQNQKQKAQMSFVDAMQKGDEVVTTSGILGKITKIEDNIVTLEISPKTYMRVTKPAISKEMTEETYKEKKA